MPIAIGLLLLAVVFLGWKLFTILGTQQGLVQDLQPDSAGDAADAQANHRDLPMDEPADATLPDELFTQGYDKESILSGLSEIAAVDGQFDPHGFANGAKSAFDLIMSAFAQGDRDALSSLVSKEVFSAFDQAIQEREHRGETLTFTIYEEPKVTFSSAELDRGMAYVGVQIQSEQSSVTTTLSDQADSDEPASAVHPQRVFNHWVFSRQTGANDPNWTLIQTTA